MSAGSHSAKSDSGSYSSLYSLLGGILEATGLVPACRCAHEDGTQGFCTSDLREESQPQAVATAHSSTRPPFEEVAMEFSWNEIQGGDGRKGFSPEQRIGSGSISTVYKSMLVDSSDVAVKVFNANLDGPNINSVLEDTRFLAGLQHPNIAMLLGYSIGPDGKTGALIFEYLPGGSLHARIHGGAAYAWHDRLQALTCAVQGKVHMGRFSSEAVHWEMKSANILFDRAGNAKIADFGFLFRHKIKKSSPGSLNPLPFQIATPGYASPELLLTGVPSLSNDVYSTGMLMLEILTGHLPARLVPDNSNRWVYLLERLKPRQPGAIMRAVAMADNKARWPCLVANVFAETALQCVHEEPDERPALFTVLCGMQAIKLVDCAAVDESPTPSEINNMKGDRLADFAFEQPPETTDRRFKCSSVASDSTVAEPLACDIEDVDNLHWEMFAAANDVGSTDRFQPSVFDDDNMPMPPGLWTPDLLVDVFGYYYGDTEDDDGLPRVIPSGIRLHGEPWRVAPVQMSNEHAPEPPPEILNGGALASPREFLNGGTDEPPRGLSNFYLQTFPL